MGDMHGAEIHQQHQHGNDHEYIDDEDDETSGVIPRIIRDLFQSMSEAPTSLECIVRCSYVEIYLEKVFDLLDPSSRSLTIVDGSTLLPLQQQLLTDDTNATGISTSFTPVPINTTTALNNNQDKDSQQENEQQQQRSSNEISSNNDNNTS